MGKGSSARRTLESSIITGLSERAHLTGASIEYAHIQVSDILDAIFAKCSRWAVRDYLREIEESEEPAGEGENEKKGIASYFFK